MATVCTWLTGLPASTVESPMSSNHFIQAAMIRWPSSSDSGMPPPWYTST
jgi:hypothetical protein